MTCILHSDRKASADATGIAMDLDQRLHTIILPNQIDLTIMPLKNRRGVPKFRMLYTEYFDTSLVDECRSTVNLMINLFGSNPNVKIEPDYDRCSLRLVIIGTRETVGVFLMGEFLAWCKPKLSVEMLAKIAPGLVADTAQIINDGDPRPKAHHPAHPAICCEENERTEL